MKSTFVFLFPFFYLSFLYSQTNYYTISGYVTDKESGELFIGATIMTKEAQAGVSTNEYGFYSLSLPEGEYQLIYSFLGYEDASIKIVLSENEEREIALSEESATLGEITVTADYKSSPNRTNEFNVLRLSAKDIQKIPSMFGEADVIKAIQTLSGVKTIGDGSSGMFIRGGSSDQNLILIDEAPIYNPSHLFGLISIFNPDALKNVTLYKSNIPAQYGGRASAVVDCKMREGNMKNFGFSAGISPFSAIVSADGPILKEKSAFFISARKSIVDFFIRPNESTPLVPAFYDFNFKLNTKAGKKNRLYFSIYNGNDQIESVDGFYNKWGNTSATLRWNHTIGTKLFSNVSLISSNYTNNLEFKDGTKKYKWLTGLKDLNAKADLSFYYKSNNVFKFGVGSIYHQFIPGETVDSLQSISRINAFEHAVYILNDINPFSWLGINYGLRLSVFQNTGKAIWYEYDEYHSPKETKQNEKGAYHSYAYLEPRISINVKLHPNYSLKLAATRNVQYMQVLQNNTLSYSSLETWFPATPNVKPIVADVISLGWFHQINEGYCFSVESYYKKYQNQVDYVDHAKLLNNPHIVGEIRNGSATAYGIELLLKKETGRLTGSISYNYSRATRTIQGINRNKKYNSSYDIPHDFRISAHYQLASKWSFAALWFYASGRPATLPVGFFYEREDPIPIYSERNASRFPTYIRLDLSINYNTKREGRKPYWTFNAGIFNVMARKNPIGYEFVRRPSSGNIEVYQYTLFTILPSFAVKYKY